MPTLDELRRWARGETIVGLPPVGARKEVERPKLADTGRVSGKYKINADCTDALLQFGVFRGQALSKLVATARGRKYLHWILEKDFDENLKAVCRYQMELAKRAAK
jgi:hypothetical protein